MFRNRLISIGKMFQNPIIFIGKMFQKTSLIDLKNVPSQLLYVH